MFARISIILLSQLMLLSVHASEPVVVGVSLDPPQDNNQKIIEPTLNVLKGTFGPTNVQIVRLPLHELERRLEAGKIDIFLSTSGLSRRMAQKGAKELATMVSDRLPNPNEAYGTLFITRKDSPIDSLADMQGHSLVANLKGGGSMVIKLDLESSLNKVTTLIPSSALFITWAGISKRLWM